MAIAQYYIPTKRKTRSNLTLAETSFRSLQEVDKELEAIQKEVDTLDQSLRAHQQSLSKVTAANSLIFEVNKDDNLKPRLAQKLFKLDKIDKITIADPKKLAQHFSLADELSDQVEKLDMVHNNVSVSFKGVRGASDILDKIKLMKKGAELKLQKSLEFLSSIGNKHAPQDFRTLVETAIGYVASKLTFKSHEASMYAYEDQGNLAFAVYIRMRNLEDEDGEIFPEFYIVFTDVLVSGETRGKVTPSYYVNVMHKFMMPGKFSKGKAVSNPADASSAIGLLMEMEQISVGIGVLPHNLSEKDLKLGNFEMGDMVSKVVVDPHSIEFEIRKDVPKKYIGDLQASLLRDLKGLTSGLKDSTWSLRPYERDGRTVFRFRITNIAQENKINVHELDFLQEQFGLDQTKLRKVVKIINED